MTILERKNLKNDSSGKERSEKGQFWKGTIGNRPSLNKKSLEKDSSGKEKSEKTQFWKGTV